MNYIFYQTKTMFSNMGDALINKSLIDVLRSYGTLKANATKNIPQDFIDELGIRSEERVNASSEFMFLVTIFKQCICSAFSKDKVFIVSGLGHLHGSSSKKIIRNLIAGLIFPLLRLFGVRIVRIGLSIGPISTGLGFTELIRSFFINYYLVRDSESLKLCHNIGIKKARLCPDLSWVYKPQTMKNNADKEGIILLNFKKYTVERNVNSYRTDLLNRLDLVLSFMVKKINDRSIKFHVIYQVTEDKEFAFEIFERYKDKYDMSLIYNQLTLNSASEYYGNSFCTLSNRMHSLLLCYKYGSLPIPLIDKAKHMKISAAFEDAGLDELILDLYASWDESQLNNILSQSELMLKKIQKAEKGNSQSIVNVLNGIFFQSCSQ